MTVRKVGKWLREPDCQHLRETSVRVHTWVWTDLKGNRLLRKIGTDWLNWENDGDILILASQLLKEGTDE